SASHVALSEGGGPRGRAMALLRALEGGAHGGGRWPSSVFHSHSMVPGGFEVMSKTTRLTPFTSLTIRLLIRASTSYGTRAQSAVIASSLVTTRTATTLAYVRKSPITPTVSSGVSTANDCHTCR